MNSVTTAVEKLLTIARTLAQGLARSASARNVVPQFWLRHSCAIFSIRVSGPHKQALKGQIIGLSIRLTFSLNIFPIIALLLLSRHALGNTSPLALMCSLYLPT